MWRTLVVQAAREGEREEERERRRGREVCADLLYCLLIEKFFTSSL